MIARAVVSVTLAFALALGVGVPAAFAAPSDSRAIPDTGLGSRSDPMTIDHGGVSVFGIWQPIFRFSSPCEALPAARADGQRIYAAVEPHAQRFRGWQLANSNDGSRIKELTLKCTTVSVGPWAQASAPTRCPMERREFPPYAPSLYFTDVGRSWAFHHGAGPILIPGHSSGTSHSPGGTISLTNIGWVRADVDVWWLCE